MKDENGVIIDLISKNELRLVELEWQFMSNGLENPISMSFNLLEDYKSLLKETLLKAKLSPVDVETVLANIEVDGGVAQQNCHVPNIRQMIKEIQHDGYLDHLGTGSSN